MFLTDWLHAVQRAEEHFERQLEELLEKFPHYKYRRRHGHRHILAVTEIAFSNHQKIGGFIMDFTLNKDNNSVRLLIQALKGGAILPDIDTVTGHPTIKDGTLLFENDANIVLTYDDPTNPKMVTVSRASNTFNGQSTLSFTAKNDEDGDISGSSIITIVSDPVVDNGIADALQAVPAPVA